MIQKFIYEYKTSSKYFLYLFVPAVIFVVLVYSMKFYKNIVINQILGLGEDILNVSAQIEKIPDINLASESFIDTVLSKLPIKTYTDTSRQIKPTDTGKPKQKKPPTYKIKFIYIGAEKRYVLIGNKLLMEGDTTSENEKIVRIEQDKVLLEGAWGKRWIYLINTQK